MKLWASRVNQGRTFGWISLKTKSRNCPVFSSSSLSSSRATSKSWCRRRQKPAPGDQIEPEALQAIYRESVTAAKIDIAVVDHLLQEGLLTTFLTYQDVKLDWLFDSSLPNDKIRVNAGRWLLKCLKHDSAELFMTTYSLWRRLCNCGSNEVHTINLARSLAYRRELAWMLPRNTVHM